MKNISDYNITSAIEILQESNQGNYYNKSFEIIAALYARNLGTHADLINTIVSNSEDFDEAVGLVTGTATIWRMMNNGQAKVIGVKLMMTDYSDIKEIDPDSEFGYIQGDGEEVFNGLVVIANQDRDENDSDLEVIAKSKEVSVAAFLFGMYLILINNEEEKN